MEILIPQKKKRTLHKTNLCLRLEKLQKLSPLKLLKLLKPLKFLKVLQLLTLLKLQTLLKLPTQVRQQRTPILWSRNLSRLQKIRLLNVLTLTKNVLTLCKFPMTVTP